jgi:hypothetical protein
MRARAAAGTYGDFEARATRVVARSTGLTTLLQDDNSIDRTPDFRLPDQRAFVALVEIATTAVGSRAAQLRAFSDGKLQFDSQELKCTWWVTVHPRHDGSISSASSSEHSRSSRPRRLISRLIGWPSIGAPLPEVATLERLSLTEVICDSRPRVGPGRIYGLFHVRCGHAATCLRIAA